MSLSPQALIRGLVQRTLPSVPNATARTMMLRPAMVDGRACHEPAGIRSPARLRDQGSYYLTNNAQAGVAPTQGTSLAAASPFILIQNQSTLGQRLYLDYISLIATVAEAQSSGATTAYIAAALVIDPVLRYSSAGSSLNGQRQWCKPGQRGERLCRCHRAPPRALRQGLSSDCARCDRP